MLMRRKNEGVEGYLKFRRQYWTGYQLTTFLSTIHTHTHRGKHRMNT